MGLRYRQRYFESGDILEPRDWNYNWAELASEVNGNLDSHNFATGAITESHIKNQAANILYSDPLTSSLTTVSDSVAWHKDDDAASPTYVGTKDVTAQVDCVLICEWGGTFTWSTVATWAGVGNFGAEADVVRFRITVDGAVIAESGFVEAGIDIDSVYLCGVAVVQAGAHTVQVEYQKVYLNNHVLQEGSDRTLTISNRELVVHQRMR